MRKFTLYIACALLLAAALSPLVLGCPPQAQILAAPACNTCEQGGVVPFEAPRSISYGYVQRQATIVAAAPVYQPAASVVVQAAPAVYAQPQAAVIVRQQAVYARPAAAVFVQRQKVFAAPVYGRSFVGRSAFFAAAPAGAFEATVVRRGLFGRVRTVVNVRGVR